MAACFGIADMYNEGKGVKKDVVKAAAMYIKFVMPTATLLLVLAIILHHIKTRAISKKLRYIIKSLRFRQ